MVPDTITNILHIVNNSVMVTGTITNFKEIRIGDIHAFGLSILVSPSAARPAIAKAMAIL